MPYKSRYTVSVMLLCIGGLANCVQAQEGGGGGLPVVDLSAGSSAGGGAVEPPDNSLGRTAGTTAKLPYRLENADGTVIEEGEYVEGRRYFLGPAMAKPRRVLIESGMDSNFVNFVLRTGQSKLVTQPFGHEGSSEMGQRDKLIPAGGIYFDAVVSLKPLGETRPPVVVSQPYRAVHKPTGMRGMMGGMGGMMGGAGASGMGSGAGGMYPGGMPGGMGGGLSMGGEEGGAMGGGMPGMEGMGGDMEMGGGMAGPAFKTLRELDESQSIELGVAPNSVKLSGKQLKVLAEMIRLDCWIDQDLTELRTARNDQEKFKALQSSLRELLSQEYELQLQRQRDDFKRLKEKLDALQEELARRSSAQERIVDVQLGQLVLEAQDLIGERP